LRPDKEEPAVQPLWELLRKAGYSRRYCERVRKEILAEYLARKVREKRKRRVRRLKLGN